LGMSTFSKATLMSVFAAGSSGVTVPLIRT
jgi:hypothetical protein